MTPLPLAAHPVHTLLTALTVHRRVALRGQGGT
jgi:hypothetical protein